MSGDNESGLQDCECLIECDGKGSLGGGERCRAERLRLLRELNAVMVKPDNESGEQAEWAVVGPDKDENKRDQYWTVERKGYPYGLDGKGNRLDPFGTFTSRIWAQQTADFANALEARAARVTQLETALRSVCQGCSEVAQVSGSPLGP
jgi:hypothetical protein